MKPKPYRKTQPADDVPQSEYMNPCIRWAYVWCKMAAQARQAGRWDWAERFTDAAEDIFERLETA